ncbi:MAG: type II toxin-antitoxin system VapC family toxin [Proteobacteria bacterium]|nr:type II toxin-antitoxin system VapC family toxin [Pseudomonadota bacterium]
MTVVVDASVALKWVLPEKGTRDADALLSQALIAPSFWLAECANALWKNVRIGKISAANASSLFQKLRRAPVAGMATDDDTAMALDLAIRLGHPIYDCLYLALALREDTYVVTADTRFVAAAASDSKMKKRVQLLGALSA